MRIIRSKSAIQDEVHGKCTVSPIRGKMMVMIGAAVRSQQALISLQNFSLTLQLYGTFSPLLFSSNEVLTCSNVCVNGMY